MTAQQKKNVAGIAVAVFTAFVLWLASVGWASKVDTSVYDLHAQREEYLHQRAAVQDSIQTSLLMELRDESRARRRNP